MKTGEMAQVFFHGEVKGIEVDSLGVVKYTISTNMGNVYCVPEDFMCEAPTPETMKG